MVSPLSIDTTAFSVKKSVHFVRLRKDAGNKVLTGSISTDCSRLVFSDGLIWSNMNLGVKTVHVVYMAQ